MSEYVLEILIDNMLPDPIKKFIDIVSDLPSIGPRQATRLAFHLVSRGRGQIYELARAVNELQQMAPCPSCFFITHKNRCPICSEPHRNKSIVCIVEKETDVISLEKAKKYTGTYLVLHELGKSGSMSPDQRLKLQSLKSRSPLQEIIIALSPTSYGDLNAELVLQEVRPFCPRITRLGRGIPTGGEIEFADPDTLAGAIDNRK